MPRTLTPPVDLPRPIIYTIAHLAWKFPPDFPPLCFDISRDRSYGNSYEDKEPREENPMTFKERMDQLFEKGKLTSKEVFDKAKEKTKELKEKTSLKMDIRHHEREAERKLGQLGSTVYDILVTKGQSTVSKGNVEIKPILTEIEEIENTIDKAEAELKKFD
jgi:hypothetical protein